MNKKLTEAISIAIIAWPAVYIIYNAIDGSVILPGKFYTCLLGLAFFAVPLSIAFLLSLVRKKLYGVALLIFALAAIAVTASEVYDHYRYGVDRFSNENKITKRYFGRKAPFFASFSTVMVYNQDIDSGFTSTDTIIKCIYRVGDKHKAESYHIAKVQIRDNEVVKELYDQPFSQDKAFTRKEFSRALKYSANALRIFEQAETGTP